MRFYEVGIASKSMFWRPSGIVIPMALKVRSKKQLKKTPNNKPSSGDVDAGLDCSKPKRRGR